jgi:hypothetical protein
MILFDPIVKQVAGPRDPNISQYEYTNRSNRNEYADLRKRAERWASRFPFDKEFLSRFKGKNDRHHQAAFFELFMHEFLMSSQRYYESLIWQLLRLHTLNEAVG